jgi:hypothetical protein
MNLKREVSLYLINRGLHFNTNADTEKDALMAKFQNVVA